MLKRAYSIIECKEFDDGERVIRGIATSATVDRVGDSVDPAGVTVAADIPLFLYHDHQLTVGRARFGKATSKGIPFEARIPKIAEPGRLKDRVDEAWQMVRHGLLTAVSIGFRVLDDAYEQLKDGGYLFKKTEVMELSLCAVPANPDAQILSVKSMDDSARIALIRQIQSIDQKHLAALGQHGAPPGQRPSPGASGQHKQPPSGGFSFSRSPKGNQVKTLAQLLEERELKAARQSEITKSWEQDDHTKTADERAEFDALESDLDALDDDIRMARMHARKAASAAAVDGSSAGAASASRGGMSFVKKEDPADKFPGQSYTRFLVAKAVAFMEMRSGNFVTPAQVAEHRWGKSHPKLVHAIKAAVAGAGTGSGEWGAELAQSNTRYSGDFIEYLWSKTVFDKLPLRAVPARIHVKGEDGAATGYWFGESKALNVSKSDYSSVELTPLKVGALAVGSKEWIMDSDPSAEMLIRDSIAEASAQRIDTTFLSATAASNGVSPAGLLNGLSGIAASGTDAAAVRADLQSLLYPFVTAKMASGIELVMNPATGLALSMLVNALGQPEFPTINENGGTLGGRRVVTGDNVTPGNIIAIRPQDVWKIGDSGIDVSMSDTATIEMNDAPAGASDTPTAMASHTVSMFQTDSVAFKVVRRINFAKRRTGAVTFVQDAEYGGVIS